MEYRHLGRTGIRVSSLCLGTMNLGSTMTEEEAFQIIDVALEAGINFFDTANNYGLLTGDQGITEWTIGRWFAQGGGRRERVILATKVHGDMHDENDGSNTVPGLSIYKVRRHFEAPLKRLQTDHVEVYHMHHVDRRVSWEEKWGAFQNLYRRGMIDYIGVSNFPAWEIARAQGEVKARHFMGISVEQDEYNLACRLPELELLPACREYGIRATTWSPPEGGLLSGKDAETLRKKSNAVLEQKHGPQLAQYKKICGEAGLEEADVALAWLLHNPIMISSIIGTRTLEQMKKSICTMEIKLDDDMLRALDEVLPGSGGETPEAYARQAAYS